MVRAREVVLQWVHVWSTTMSDRLRSVHFTRRSCYYATATKPDLTCSEEGCLKGTIPGTQKGQAQRCHATLTVFQTTDAAWIMRYLLPRDYSTSLAGRRDPLDSPRRVWTYPTGHDDCREHFLHISPRVTQSCRTLTAS